ncbi:MAG: tRNA (N6-threonylcarbamoyladenosine(37)-N6)-methyltransferase TrmO [Kiritimatiellaeota bacterium]|nr:tRNA (N6-threonylcarbamoyladenosine(37)-N6)-methyltransferase TrmO [Kiritimatiellota bacterium]
MNECILNPIGVIHTPFKETSGIPIQPPGATGTGGRIEVFEEFADGLKDLEGFSHIILLFLFHESKGFKLQVSPFLENDIHGVFAVRAPKRPNPLGLSIIRLLKVEGNVLTIDNPDMLDGTPLLDIKPYIPDFDAYPDAVAGWQEKHKGKVRKQKSDARFG